MWRPEHMCKPSKSFSGVALAGMAFQTWRLLASVSEEVGGNSLLQCLSLLLCVQWLLFRCWTGASGRISASSICCGSSLAGEESIAGCATDGGSFLPIPLLAKVI